MPRANIWDPRFTRLQHEDAGCMIYGPPESHWDEIVQAAHRNDVETIKALAPTLNREQLDQRGWDDSPPIVTMAQYNSPEAVAALLQVNPEGFTDMYYYSVDSQQRTALHWAAKKGYIGVMKELWKLHPDARMDLIYLEDVYNENALSYAASKGHVEALKMILGEQEEDFNIINQRIGTPRESSALIDAVINGHLEIVRLLMAHKSIRPNEKYGPPGQEQTALEVAETIAASKAIKAALRKQ